MRSPAAARIWLLPISILLLALVAYAQPAWSYNVDEVRIEGNESFSDKQLKKLMRTRDSSWYKKRPLIKRDLELDLANIEAFYHKNGFLDCVVEAGQSFLEGTDKVEVRLDVQEGPRTYVERLSFAGNARLSSSDLSRDVATQVGQPLNLSLLHADIEVIEDKYGDAGYPYAQATADIHREESRAKVIYDIVEGPAVYLGNVKYIGLKQVKKFVVHRELTVHPGDLYNRLNMIDSRQRINSTGLFSYVNVRLERAGGDSLRPDLAVMVQERPMRWVGLKSEIGQDEQYDLTSDLTAEWGNKNLFGSGRKLSLQAIATFRVFTEWENLRNRFELTYTEPWFLGHRMPAWVSLYFEPGLKSKGRSYRVQRFGSDFNISRELGTFSRAWLTLRYERVDIFGLEPEAAEVLRLSQGVRIRRKISLSWERDTRDHIFEPTRGSLAQFYNDFIGGPLGGDDHYIKTVISWNKYQVFLHRAVLASRVRIGWAEEYGSGVEVPPDARFYAGGANTVRGVAERSLGSIDPAGNPLGGKGLLLLNVELRRALWRRLGGSLFFDVGNVWSRPRKAAFDQLTTSTGLELWFSTPVGPVRVAYGVPLAKKVEPTKGHWHLAILFAF